jgi:hypothetical protein
MEKKIKIGTKVKVELQGREIVSEVTRIERCECGEKYGEPIGSVRMDEAKNSWDYDYTFTLDCGRWCYGEQILEVVEG